MATRCISSMTILIIFSAVISTTSQCSDDVNFNCQLIGSTFNVCADVAHAKIVCRKYCGLCNVGKIDLERNLICRMSAVGLFVYRYQLVSLFHI